MQALSRRSFLRGALTVAAASAVPLSAFAAPVPMIYGDGVHDDWAGLQAMLDGREFAVARTGLCDARKMWLRGGHYMLSRPFKHWRLDAKLFAFDTRFTALPSFEGEAVLDLGYGAPAHIDTMHVSGRGLAKYAMILPPDARPVEDRFYTGFSGAGGRAA